MLIAAPPKILRFAQVGDRLPAARSRRLEVDVELRHFLRVKAAKNERAGFAKMCLGLRAAESGRRSSGSFRESEEKWRRDAGRGMRGLFTGDAIIALEF